MPPGKMALLGIGAVAALGFAGWSVFSSIRPAPKRAAPPAAPTVPGAKPAPSAPAAVAEGGAIAAPGVAPKPAGAEPDPKGQGYREADPFAPTIGITPLPNGRAAPASTGRANPAILPRGAGPQALPGPGGPPMAVMPVAAAPPPAIPRLVGTMRGERPAAVFERDAGYAIVAQGEKLDGWRVVQVDAAAVKVQWMKDRRWIRVAPAKAAAGPGGAASKPDTLRAQLPSLSPSQATMDASRPAPRP